MTEKTDIPWCDEWCEVLLRRYADIQQRMQKRLAHHSKTEDKCDYAMNANWTPDSPPRLVLAFEAKAGWDQCGGPELFAFENHDPRGGCVLLNDGTVKFIRTKEELKQLQWK